MANVYKKIGMRIKLHRVKMGLTQTELAKKVGAGQATVNDWESGKKLPSLSKAYMLCEIFNVEMDFFDLKEKTILV